LKNAELAKLLAGLLQRVR